MRDSIALDLSVCFIHRNRVQLILEVRKRCVRALRRKKEYIFDFIFFLLAKRLCELENMHLIAFVCCIWCLALTGAAQSDVNAIETGQLVLTLKETQNVKSVQKRQVPLYPLLDPGFYPGSIFEIQPFNASAPRLQYVGVAPQYQKFVNETLSRVPSGFCQREVP